MICPVVTRIAAAAFALCASSGMLMAQQSMTASPTPLNFSYSTAQTTQVDVVTTVTSPTTTFVTATLSDSLGGLLTLVNGSVFGVGPAGTTVIVRLQNPNLATTARSGELRLTGPNVNTLIIPITLSPNGTGGTTGLTASPNFVNMSYTPGSLSPVPQTITLSSSIAGQLTPTLSFPLSQYMYVTPNPVSTNSAFTLYLNPQFASSTTATTGTLTLSGSPGSINIPITITPFGSSGSNITANPSVINFNSTTLSQFVQLGAPVITTLGVQVSSNFGGWIVAPSTVQSNGSFTIQLQNAAAFPSGASGSVTLTPLTAGTGLSALTIPINIGGSGTSGSLSSNPASLTFSYANGTTTQISESMSTSSPTSVLLTSSVTGSLAGYISVPATVFSNTTFQVTLTSPGSFTTPVSGTLTLSPPVGSGLNTLQVPIYVNPGGTSGSGLTTSPTSLNFTFAPGTTISQTQGLFLSSSIASTVNITASANLIGYLQFPSTASTGQQISVTLPYPASVPSGTTGTLTLTPTTLGLAPINVPVSINATGVGGGSLVTTPNTLTFNLQLGATAVAEQTVTVTNPNNISDFITVGVDSANNFLSFTQGGSATPSTITVRVNPSSFSQVGVYSGTITVYRINSTTVLATIPVTVNVTQSVRVTPNPSAVTLSGVTGGAASTQSITVGGDTTAAFTAAATTTSGGNWLTVSPTSGNLGSAVTVSASPTGLAVGTYQGAVTIQVGGAVAATIPVTYTVASPSALQLSPGTLTFNYQTTASATPAAQTVQVNSSASGINLNWTAAASSSGGWLSVTPTTGTTPGSFSVSVNPTGLAANTYTGTITVTSAGATNSPQTISVTLNVTSPAVPLVTAVLSAASLAPSVTAPGAIITLRGTNLGPADGVSGSVTNGMLSTNVSGVTVTFDGVPAPLLYVSATQINAVVPYEVSNRLSTRVVITAQGQASREIELRVGETAPALFTANSSGTGPAAALNQNGSINSATNPETKGNIIVLFGTGEGQTNPAGVTGQVVAANALRRPVAPVAVRIAGQPAEVLYAGSLPGIVGGALQINVRIPANIPSGAVPVDIQIGAASNQSAVTIAVQ